MPPWARAPCTSYWPATRSPFFSLGVNEYGLRHLGQKPSSRPSSLSCDRPTGEPQWGQTRLSSGIAVSFMTAVSGSTYGAGGTDVSPAPNRAARSRFAVSRMRLVERLAAPPARAEPRAVELSTCGGRRQSLDQAHPRDREAAACGT